MLFNYETDQTILEFRKEYFFLSNFYCAEIVYFGLLFKNNEAAFQAMKCPDQAEKFIQKTPLEAKCLGRRVPLRKDWEQVKECLMYEICFNKFTQNQVLKEKLLATGRKHLVEGNTWGDTEWGICNGKGENKLGKILMRIREELRNGSAE